MASSQPHPSHPPNLPADWGVCRSPLEVCCLGIMLTGPTCLLKRIPTSNIVQPKYIKYSTFCGLLGALCHSAAKSIRESQSPGPPSLCQTPKSPYPHSSCLAMHDWSPQAPSGRLGLTEDPVLRPRGPSLAATPTKTLPAALPRCRTVSAIPASGKTGGNACSHHQQRSSAYCRLWRGDFCGARYSALPTSRIVSANLASCKLGGKSLRQHRRGISKSWTW